MMYRRNEAQQPRIANRLAVIAKAFAGSVSGLFGLLPKGLFEQAEQENRRRDRYRKRHLKHSSWRPNGVQECARRRRQIAAGQLTESNGLVLVRELRAAA